ncbi:hypothetical protein ACTG11_23445 [Aeromonas hydrophila]
MNHTERLQACLQHVVCNPRFTLAELDQWFTLDYCQQVNGEQLDYAAFRHHRHPQGSPQSRKGASPPHWSAR